jgi:eukaryotic-like serine/threonine-protein kinase
MPLPPPALTAALSDRYAFEQELGRGGMATVYLAEDRKHGRQVAIKVLHADLAASIGAERFLREIRIAARLSHPHILPLIDSGEAGGFLYYVTPYVAGGSVRERLRLDGRMALAAAVRIVGDVGGALDYAHRQGIVHRDVKPENVLFADGHAVLADFGIARACSEIGADAVTSAGIILGTPEYMSPEQAAGERALSPASDAYSLACVAYELLAGATPLRGAGAQATMAKQVTETPLPLRALRPELPAWIERTPSAGARPGDAGTIPGR